MLTIVETPHFQREWPHYWSETEYSSFVSYIAAHPDAGDVLTGTGGMRKVRWFRSGTGKSGGVRVIYFTRNSAGQIVLLSIYAKATMSNMTAAQLKEIRHEYEKIIAAQR